MHRHSAAAPTQNRSEQDMQELWQQYKETGDLHLRNRLVMAQLPMVQYIVAKKVRELPAHANAEDFVSCGIIALIGAIERYDDDKGATFKQFAWTRVQGAVIDELRRLDWAPRSLRRWERDISSARERFVGRHGRRPSREELAKMVGLDPEDVRRREDEVHMADVVSLNAIVGNGEGALERGDTLAAPDGRADPETTAMRRQGKALFRQAFAALAEREREVAVMLYLKNMTLREIGDQLGISESRVCQLHTQIRSKLARSLANDRELLSAAG